VRGVQRCAVPICVPQGDATVVEIGPAETPDTRFSFPLVGNKDSEVVPQSPVTAGITEVGEVADSARVLKPQLAAYTSDAGNHVSMSASQGD